MQWWLVATLVSVATAASLELADAKRAFLNSGAVELSVRDHRECIVGYLKGCNRQTLFIEYYNGSDPEYYSKHAPSLSKFAKDMSHHHPEVTVSFFDCDINKFSCDRVDLTELPSRRLHHLKETIIYNGALDWWAVVKRLRLSIEPSPLINNLESLDRLCSNTNKPKILLINPQKAYVSEREQYYNFARMFSDQFTCALIAIRSIIHDLQERVPQVAIGDGPMWLYVSADGQDAWPYPDDNFDIAYFLVFVGLGDYPVTIFDATDLYNPVDAGRNPSEPAAVLLVDRTSDADTWGPELAALARDCGGLLQFGIWNIKTFRSGLPTVFPKTALFAIYDYPSGQVHAIDSQDHPNGIQFENIEAMVMDFLAGDMKYRSEPVPVANGPVTILVGENVLEAIGNVSQTVFVNYCEDGQCRANQTIWQSLAAHYADNDTVLVAQYDFIKNERVPGKRVYAPTLAMYPAHGVVDDATRFRNPVYYNERVSLTLMIDFVEHGDPYGGVVELSQSTFEKFIVDHDEVGVWFYSPSRIGTAEVSFTNAKADFDSMATYDPHGTFARVNCDQERYLCFRYSPLPPAVETIGSYRFGIPVVDELEEFEELFSNQLKTVILHLNPTKASTQSFKRFAQQIQPRLYSLARIAEDFNEFVEMRFPDTELGDEPTWWVIPPSNRVGVLTGNRLNVSGFKALVRLLSDSELKYATTYLKG